MENISDKLNVVIELFNKGKKQEALKKINLLLNKKKESLDLLLLHAKICINLNEIDKSNNSLLRILNINPDNNEVIKLLYINYFKLQKFSIAQKYIDKLLVIENNSYEVLRDKAFIEYLNKNYSTSENYIKKAISINNKDVFGLNILGLLYLQKKETFNAIDFFEKAILINPNYADSYNNLGKCYIDLEKLNLAYLNFKKGYRINPRSDLSIINIANILSLKDKNKLAIKFYEKAKEINPNNKQAQENIIICNIRLKNLKFIENKILNQQNTNKFSSDIILGYSYLLLNKKRFEEGFSYFDARLNKDTFQEKNIYHNNIIKKINAQDKFKKSNNILIIKEQGVGDEILFSSMYNDLIKSYSNVKIECDKRLLKIFERSFKNNIFFPFGHFSSLANNIEEFDNVCYAGSLAKDLRRNEKDFRVTPYLKSLKNLDNKYNIILNNFNDKKRIGISWKSVVNIYGGLKSLKLNNFYKLFSNNRIFINLQYGNTLNEIQESIKKERYIYNFDNVDLFNDFESLISILKNLDVFVTVSNSTAHFAGALGVKTILICPKKSSTYYYWDYDDGKTPWYKSVSIVKFQKSLDHTMGIVNELIDEVL